MSSVLAELSANQLLVGAASRHAFETQIRELHKQAAIKEAAMKVHGPARRGRTVVPDDANAVAMAAACAWEMICLLPDNGVRLVCLDRATGVAAVCVLRPVKITVSGDARRTQRCAE
jgi:hypothetical protein